jgi:hypothetical protein
MKKLALLMFTILILGCGNENPVSEPNEDLAEIQAIADQLSQAAASLDISAPTITASSVTDGDTDVDPELLNREGIRITFSERISLSHFNLHYEDGTSRDWKVEWSADGQTVTLTPPHLCSVLRAGTTYTIDFVVQDFGSWKIEDSITFSTKPRPVNAAPALDIRSPNIQWTSLDKWTSTDGQVDPEPLNLSGITIAFDQDIAVGHFDLRLIAFDQDIVQEVAVIHSDRPFKDGPTLGWIVQWSDQRTVTLTPPNACSVLQKGANYLLKMRIMGYSCHESVSYDSIFRT